jgi:hypothetical protein
MNDASTQPGRRRGRPPKSSPLPPREPVELAVPDAESESHRIPTMRCPYCNRGMAPRVVVTRAQYTDLECRLCGKKFDYRPSDGTIRIRPPFQR